MAPFSRRFVYSFNDKNDFALHLALLNRARVLVRAPAWSISTEFMSNVVLLGIIAETRARPTTIFVRSMAIILKNGPVSDARVGDVLTTTYPGRSSVFSQASRDTKSISISKEQVWCSRWCTTR